MVAGLLAVSRPAPPRSGEAEKGNIMRLTAFFSICGIVLILAGCVPPPTTEERHSAVKTTMLCMQVAAKRLDDHLSDATTIAVGILGACDLEVRRLEATASQGMDFEGYQTVKRRLNEFF